MIPEQAQVLEDTERRDQLLALLAYENLVKNSSIPGFNKLSDDSSSKLRKGIWIFVIVTGFLCFLVHFGFLLHRYIQSPVILESQYNAVPFQFPDVTLCHTGPYSWSRTRIKANHSVGSDVFVSNNDIVTRIKNYWKAAIPKLQKLKLNKYTRDDNVVARNTLFQWGLTFNFGHAVHELVLHCEFQGKPCDFTNFTTVVIPDHFNCFTFKPAKTNRIMNKAGEADGLSLILMDADRRKFMTEMETLDFIRGINVIVHASDTYPDFVAVDVAQVGLFTKIPLEMVEFQRISRKSARCREKMPDIESCPINHIGNRLKCQSFSYSTKGCLEIAAQKQFIEKCACLSEHYLIPKIPSNQSSIDFCHSLPASAVANAYSQRGNETFIRLESGDEVPLKTVRLSLEVAQSTKRYACHDRLYRTLNFQEMEKNCSVLCDFHHYHTSATKYNWPTAAKYAKKPLQEYGQQALAKAKSLGLDTGLVEREIFRKKHTLNYIRENFARLLLYPRSDGGLLLAESLAYPWSTFLSDIGGILGLWIGFSIITIVEVIEGFLTVCFLQKKNEGKRKQKKKTKRTVRV